MTVTVPINTPAQNINVASITLESNATYLVIGSVEMENFDTSIVEPGDIMSCAFLSDPENFSKFGIDGTRTVCVAGGGLNALNIIKTKSKTCTLQLNSYNYYDPNSFSYDLNSTIIAIKLK